MKKFQKNFALTVVKQTAGFSLVELLVGVIIALITSIAIFQVFATYQSQKQSTTSESDALQSGTLAVYHLRNELKDAGRTINTDRIHSPGKISPLLGCRVDIVQVNNTPANQQSNVKNGLHEKISNLHKADSKGLSISGTIEGHNLLTTGNGSTLPLAPLLIKTSTGNQNLSDIADVPQDIILSMAGTTSVPGIAPICAVKSDAKTPADCNATANGTYIALGYKSSQKNGKVEVKPIPENSATHGVPIGFCSSNGPESLCQESILLISNNFKKCRLTATEPKEADLATNGDTMGMLKSPVLKLQDSQAIDANAYKNGYVMTLGRLNYRNISKAAQTRFNTGGFDNSRRSGFAMFTVGKDGQAAGNDANVRIGSSNLLRYDLLNNHLEVVADNIVLLKAIYAVAPADTSRKKENRNSATWVKPEGAWEFDQVNTDADKIRQIRAVKIAVVARNAFPEEVAFNQPEIKLFEKELGNNSIRVTLKNDDVKKYRYEVFEFVVPLQNAQYGFDQAYASCMDTVANCKQ